MCGGSNELDIFLTNARGCTQFGNGTFRGEGEPPDPFYERGCRHPVEIEGQTYMIDALEMPSKHLLSNPMLEQALGITEAAVLIYDVRDPASLRLAEGIAEFMRDTLTGKRDYGLMLVGNKSDADDEERKVPWAQGSKAAAAIRTPTQAGANSAACAFLEVSAKSGDNIEKLFPQVAREVLKLKWLTKQRREQAEKAALERQAAHQAARAEPMKKKLGLWKVLSTPFLRRQSAY